MKRLWMFWRGLPLGSKLQYVALGLLLGAVFVLRDLHPRLRWFGRPLWQITAPLILMTFVLGRMLLPLMLRNPARTQRLLAQFGWAVFGLGLLTSFWGKRLLIVQVGLTTLMWLDVSCSFWFISEIQLRAAALLAARSGTDDNSDPEADKEQEEE